ncbi:hypothetical protein PAPYR_11924 [Paratrimastix pyriformis]|uniref:Uncharacterized protein n=1 Tax=Paratrimastix pyriformis TaxID=342808 RepID=A0ABQ8U8A6_9EUKA|nr:hypothetical protein PAPYR_11924 [Paratrimastix pyriformis]
MFQGRLVTFQPLPCSLERLISLINSSRLSLPTSSWVAAFYFVRVTGPFAGLSRTDWRRITWNLRIWVLLSGADESVRYSVRSTPRCSFGTTTNFFIQISEMLVVSLLAMSQTLRSHSSTCDSEIRTITGHARNSFRAQVLLKPVFHLGLIDLVAREGEYSERSESLLNNRPVVLWVCTWHLHVALFIPWPFFVPEGKPPTSNLSLRQNDFTTTHTASFSLFNTHWRLQERSFIYFGRAPGAANSPVSDRRHDDSVLYSFGTEETPPLLFHTKYV